MPTTVTTGAQKFTMNGLQLLASGTQTTPMLACENMWLHSKVYSRGGENALHAHVTEDHTFFVLQGAAEFTLGDGSTMLAERFEGVMIPKGTHYKFEAQGEGNLIMLRIGAGVEAPATVRNAFGLGDAREGPVVQLDIVDEDNRPILDNNSAQKGRSPSEPRIPIPGRFFGSELSRS
jgi:mannose-6-phosphate isomerase-like protein (cupin superfamily)